MTWFYTRGAAIRLQQELFYLRSRGIGANEAAHLLLEGFCNQILTGLPGFASRWNPAAVLLRKDQPDDQGPLQTQMPLPEAAGPILTGTAQGNPAPAVEDLAALTRPDFPLLDQIACLGRAP